MISPPQKLQYEEELEHWLRLDVCRALPSDFVVFVAVVAAAAAAVDDDIDESHWPVSPPYPIGLSLSLVSLPCQ